MKGGMGLLIGLGKASKGKSGDDEEMDDAPDSESMEQDEEGPNPAEEEAADALIDAVRAKDAAGVFHAVKALVAACKKDD